MPDDAPLDKIGENPLCGGLYEVVHAARHARHIYDPRVKVTDRVAIFDGQPPAVIVFRRQLFCDVQRLRQP